MFEIDLVFEIIKNIGPYGAFAVALGYYIMHLNKRFDYEREQQRRAHTREMDDLKNDNKRLQSQVINVLKNTNDIDNELAKQVEILIKTIEGLKK